VDRRRRCCCCGGGHTYFRSPNSATFRGRRADVCSARHRRFPCGCHWRRPLAAVADDDDQSLRSCRLSHPSYHRAVNAAVAVAAAAAVAVVDPTYQVVMPVPV